MVAAIIKFDDFLFIGSITTTKVFFFYATKAALAGLYHTQYMFARWLGYYVQSLLIRKRREK